MSITNTKQNQLTIERLANPAGFYQGHAEALHIVGASAFGQPVEAFAPQVAERFAKAEIAQVMRDGDDIVGFALYEMLQGSHWRPAFN
ncbi:MAG TPA: hypothetical protein VLF62_00690 [Candidatus Saccharimonadales bacterium]|nr:hypothetical protein [Candidatus Saccharimonadales bacterium]